MTSILRGNVSFPVLASVALLGLAGCPGHSDSDAGDAATDAARDVQTDVQGTDAADTGSDTGSDSGSDSSSDVPSTDGGDGGVADGGSCTGTDAGVDPQRYNFITNTVDLGYGYDPDPTMAGFGSRVVAPSTGTVAAPDDMEGSCVFHAVRLTGNADRNTAPTLNGGTITITQGTQVDTLTYDSTMMAYTGDDSNAQAIMFGMPVAFHFAGGPDFAATTATSIFPPAVNGTTFTGLGSTTTLGEVFSSTADNTINWTAPTDTSCNLAVSLFILDMDNARVITCATAASAGHITVPHGLYSRHYTESGYNLFLGVGFSRVVTVNSMGHDWDLRLDSYNYAFPNST